MKKSISILVFLFVANLTFAQTDYEKTPLKTTEDCKKAEPLVLEAAKYVLSKPIDDSSALPAIKFVLTWMTNSEHTFSIDSKFLKIGDKKDNADMLGIYMCCMAKFGLENLDKIKDNHAVLVGTYILLADYIGDKSKNVKINKAAQKLIDAKNKGKMEEFVDK